MSDLRPRSSRSENRPGIARHGQLKKPNGFATAGKIVAGALAVMLFSGASVGAIAAWNVMSGFKEGVTLENEATAPAASIEAIAGGVNLLLVGSDSRKGQGTAYGSEDETGTLNDVTMLLHIAEDHSNATVVSFPRDLFVPIPACKNPETGARSSAVSSDKINTTLSRGGLSCTVSTVEKLTGLSIPYAAEIQFNGVIEMSNAVGGVPVCVAESIDDDYTGTHLEAGEHVLQGMQALQFLRTRHGVGDGSDLARISSQQVFLSSLVRTIQSGSTLTDVFKLYGLAKAASNNMTLSNSLNNLDTMVSIALALKDISLNRMAFVQYPGYLGDGGVLPNEESADALFEAIRADRPLTLGGAMGDGAVLEAGAAGGEADGSTGTPTPSPSPSSGSSSTNGDGAPTPGEGGATAPDGTALLPSDVQGQTAGQYTCSKGGGLGGA